MAPRNDNSILNHQLSYPSSDDDTPASASSLEGSTTQAPRTGRFGQLLLRHNDTIIDDDEDYDSDDQQLFFVTSYSDFDKLAHGPRGHGAKHTLRVYKFVHDGSLVLWHIAGDATTVINPAFSRFHPR